MLHFSKTSAADEKSFCNLNFVAIRTLKYRHANSHILMGLAGTTSEILITMQQLYTIPIQNAAKYSHPINYVSLFNIFLTTNINHLV